MNLERAPQGGVANLQAISGHRTLTEGAFTTLHEAIITGVLKPGEKLPIDELAGVLGMSPMPIREALRRLDAVGLIEKVPHRGAVVTGLSIPDLEEVYEARLALESMAVARAAERFTVEDAKESRRRLKEHVQAYKGGTVRDIWATHTAFHFSLYDASRSRWLVRVVRPLWESSERYRYAILPIRSRIEARREQHQRILQACIDHEPELAADVLHNHLAATANELAVEMGGEDLFELRPVVEAAT